MTDPFPPRPTARTRIDLPHADTLAGYDRWAASYDAADNPMVAATAWALSAWPFAVHGRDVVEPGCGTGRHADVLLAGGARSYTGIDGSAGMLDVARRRTADARATWRQGELHALPVADGSHDRALVVLVFEHVRDLRPACAELARVLRRGARLRILEIHGDLVASGTNAHFAERDREVRFASTAHAPQELARELTHVGFAIERCAEHAAAGPLLQAVPRLAKHAGRRVLIDVEAVRG